MKLPRQVEAIIFKKVPDAETSRDIGSAALEFLALHRTPERGGFWQPLTGGVEDFDASDEAAILREAGEELGLRADQILRIFKVDHEFSFPDDRGIVLTERCFGVEVPHTADIQLSDEHDEAQWGPEDRISALFKWDDNKIAMRQVATAVQAEISHQPIQ